MSETTTVKPLGITELVLRDAHQSLLATRMRIEDMLPIAPILDEVGFWSIESWGGAIFDSCIRYLGEDPWERIRELKKVMPKTKQQMLFRGQNILGYRHYADDLVEKFVERSFINGVEVFRVFDAMNDVRNMETAIKATNHVGGHAQGTLSYTVSPVHDLETWLTMAKILEDMGSDSLCIKDMAGLLKPYVATELITELKKCVDIPIALHCHATTGLSVATHMKAIDANIDVIDTAISSMSMTYGHSATETIVSIVEDTPRDTGIDLQKLEQVATYFRKVRKKYAKFEGSLKGIDARILTAQVPGGMLTNMENQLREQGAADKLNDVLTEIPKVRKDLGYIPLVTPTSQIVGSQAVLNVLTGERYKSITKETAGVLKGEYGATAAPVNTALQQKVLEGAEAISCRPADLLKPEVASLTEELLQLAQQENIHLADEVIDDVLIYALFPQIGLKFLKNRNNKDAFEPAPQEATTKPKAPPQPPLTAQASQGVENYTVTVDGKNYAVQVAASGTVTQVSKQPAAAHTTGETLKAPLSGNIFKINVNVGDHVNEGDVLIILEAMKMETEVVSSITGTLAAIHIKTGDNVKVGETLLSFE
ncbi:sodium-extruding oxaloacetate decarboxylase subunit alpha [Marinicella litoralis]|uniref:Oxaloacetate decarboxylase alpha subunit n=1 Tax=Marinicella litoralis TaxID=644220 RepID=A0A4R6XKG1_9GAMM|nr:sodium-extruding oxaloacetate decarboxylase subunit alpha [Marinicella litoralis]TDR18470.1 oxaloacetate decarboxylase alpha subunit [Marinicella litoralis]